MSQQPQQGEDQGGNLPTAVNLPWTEQLQPGQGHLPDSTNLPLTVDPALRDRAPRIPTGDSVLDEGSIEEFGRTYTHFKPDKYVLPNDGEEQNRLDIQHNICLMLMDDRLHWAPIHQPRRILDIGTGTGIWAIEMAKEYPAAEVVATDLSAIQPSVVPNFEFIREDAEDPWSLNRTFDFIHARLFCSFVKDFKAVLVKAMAHLEPGGWIELQEVAMHADTLFSGNRDSAFKKVMDAFIGQLQLSGRDPFMHLRLKEVLAEVGFVEIEESIQPLPVGEWPEDEKYKRIGKWNAMNCMYAMESMIKPLVAAGRSPANAKLLTIQAQAEIRSNALLPFGPFRVVVARKPL